MSQSDPQQPVRTDCPEPRAAATTPPARRRVAVLLGILALFLLLPHVVYHYIWLGDQVQTLGNAYLVYQPRQMMLWMTSILEGHFPLWLPFDAGGRPHSFHAFAGTYWPLTWLLMRCPAALEGQLIRILDHWHLLTLGLAGFCTYLWLRRLQIHMMAALFGGAVFIFNTRMLDTFRFGAALDVVVWLPVLVYLLERMLSRPKRAFFLIYPLAQHMMLAPGHWQEAAYCLLLINLYALVRGLSRIHPAPAEGRAKWYLQRAGYFAAAQLLGLGISAVQLLPIYWEALPLAAVREGGEAQGGVPYQYFLHLTWRECVLNVLFPWYTSAWSNFYSAQIVWILFLMSPLLLFWQRRRISGQHTALAVFFLLFFILCVCYACGPETPVAPMVNACIPVFRSMRAPGRIMTVGMFAQAGLIAITLNGLPMDQPPNRKLRTLVTLGCFAYLAAGLGLWVGIESGIVELGIQRVYLPLLWHIPHGAPAWMFKQAPQMTALMILIIGLIALANWSFMIFAKQRRWPLQVVVAAFLMTLSLETSLYHQKGTWYVHGKPSSPPRIALNDMDFYHNRVSHSFPYFNFWCFHADLNDAHNRKYLLDRGEKGLFNLLVEGGRSGQQLYYQTLRGAEIPRAYLTPHVTLVKKDALSVVREMNPYETSVIDLSDPVNITATYDEQLSAIARQPASAGATNFEADFKVLNEGVQVTSYTFNKASFAVKSVRGGLFNYNDTYAPGWWAEVDGRRTKIYRSNSLFKALPLSPGTHTVSFVYDPAPFRLGLWISLCALTVVIVMSGVSVFRKRAHRRLCAAVLLALCGLASVMLHRELYARIHQDGFVFYNPTQPPRTLEPGEYYSPPWGEI